MRSILRSGVLPAIVFCAAALLSGCVHEQKENTLNGHTVRLDGRGKLLSWVANQNGAYHHVLKLATTFLLNDVPTASNGLKLYYTYSYALPNTMAPGDWPHNPAGLYAMLTDSGLAYWAYSGNPAIMTLVHDVLSYHLDHGMTPVHWHWGGVPFASSDAGKVKYEGARFGDSNGRGDGVGVIEPDKVGELGLAFLKYYQYSNEIRFRDAAIRAANVLAAHIRIGDATRSPWPFRVYAETNVVREQYCANVIAPIKLFDALMRLKLGNFAAYQTARQAAWTWMMTYPIQNSAWANYFEDVPITENLSNTNQLIAAETARYLMQHPEMDSNWEIHVRSLIAWIEATFGGSHYGATTIAEQTLFRFRMGSHTSRYASINAMLFELTGDLGAKEKALRSFNWATYMCGTTGRCIDGPEVNRMWWTDGYADYIKHFIAGMGAVPEWAPVGETHLLRSTSVVRSVRYIATEVSYEAADASGTEVLRLAFAPRSVTAGGVALPLRHDLAKQGWTYDRVGGVVRVRHDSGTSIRISGGPQQGK